MIKKIITSLFVCFSLVLVLVSCTQKTEDIVVENETTLQIEDVSKIVDLTKKHFQYAIDNDFEKYSETMHPQPEAIEEGTPFYDIWRDAREKKIEIKGIYFRVIDDIGRPRVIADVEWTDRLMQIAYHKFDDDWKVASLD